MAVVQMKVTGAIRYEKVSWQRRFWVTFVGLVVRERTQLLLHWVLVHKIYSHIPYFHPADLARAADTGKADSTAGVKSSSGKRCGDTLLPGVPAVHGNVFTLVSEWVRYSLASQVVLSLLVALVINRKARCVLDAAHNDAVPPIVASQSCLKCEAHKRVLMLPEATGLCVACFFYPLSLCNAWRGTWKSSILCSSLFPACAFRPLQEKSLLLYIFCSHVVHSCTLRPLEGKFSFRRFVWEIEPLQFLAKLAIVRVAVDVLFAGGHWVIHRPALYHSSVVAHKTHHGHHHPSVVTNQHFSIADLFVEACVDTAPPFVNS